MASRIIFNKQPLWTKITNLQIRQDKIGTQSRFFLYIQSSGNYEQNEKHKQVLFQGAPLIGVSLSNNELKWHAEHCNLQFWNNWNVLVILAYLIQAQTVKTNTRDKSGKKVFLINIYITIWFPNKIVMVRFLTKVFANVTCL